MGDTPSQMYATGLTYHSLHPSILPECSKVYPCGNASQLWLRSEVIGVRSVEEGKKKSGRKEEKAEEEKKERETLFNGNPVVRLICLSYLILCLPRS